MTIRGEAFDHLLFEFVLVASSWTAVKLAYSESYETLVDGLQSALWKLGGVPRQLCLDNMSAATHELRKGHGSPLRVAYED